MNEKLLRAIVLVVAAVVHLLVLFFLVFNTEQVIQEAPENARVMKLTDLDELPPPPPELDIPQVEEIAETMIETDIPPVQEIVAAGTLTETFLEMRYLSTVPQFDMNAITADLVYPPIALRSGIEGRVILELFIDRTGTVQRITILQEKPPDRGFGEAAVRALTGRRGTPATSNGEPVSCRYRFPVVFRIR
jgi:protein TonB